MRLYHFPEDLERIVAEHAGGGEAELRAAAGGIRALSDLFNGKRPWSGDYARDPELRRAYLAYFLRVNLPKIRVPLAALLAARPDRWARRPLRVLDLGSGPGTALLGLCDFVRELPPHQRPSALELVAADQSRENLSDAAALLDRLAASDPRVPALRIETLRLDLVSDRAQLFPLVAADGRFDLVLAANVLGEIVREAGGRLEAAEALVDAAAEDVLAHDGAVVVLEPALRESARDLHRLRDRLLASRSLHVVAPCLHEEPCPALAVERDWCVAELAWEPPPFVVALDRRTGLRKTSLKFAYLVLTREPSPAEPSGACWRVVSDVLELKGERRVYLCAAGRWIVLGQLEREVSQTTASFERLRRGDLVEVHGLERRGSLHRLPASGSIRRLSEAPAGLAE